MRHGKVHRKLNRTAEHRTAMFANMAASLIKHEQIVTTLPKAKELRPIVEKLVTLAKKGGAACPPPGDRGDPRCRPGQEALRRDRPALQGARRRLYPHHEGRASATATTRAKAVIEFVDRDVEAKGKDSGPVQETKVEEAATAAA